MRNNMNVSAFGSLLVLLLSLSGANLSHADEAAKSNQFTRSSTEHVNFSDLNLARVEGVITLHERLRKAASNVCGTRPYRSLPARRDWKSCYTAALDDAVQAVGHPQLDTIHAGNVIPTGEHFVANAD